MIQSLWLLTLFFSAYVVIFVWLVNKQDNDNSFLNPRTYLFTAALVYFILANLSAYSAIGYESAYMYNGTCEYVVDTESFDATTNVTTYAYTNPCAGNPRYEVMDNWVVIYTWMLFIGALLIMFHLIRLVGKVVNLW